MILKIYLNKKAGVPKTLVKLILHLHSMYFPQNTLMHISLSHEMENRRGGLFTIQGPIQKVQ